MSSVGPVTRTAVVTGNPYAPGGRVCVKHSEYCMDLACPSTGYTLWSVQVNPGFCASPQQPTISGSPPYTNGSLSLFAWLQNMANLFQQYRVKKISFRVETEAATSQGGSIMMAFDTNVQDTSPGSKQELMQFPGAVRGPPWSSMVLTLDPKQMKNVFSERYIRAATASTQVIGFQQYDLGFIYVGMQGVAVGLAFEFYVDYEFEFWDPVAYNVNPYPQAILQDVYGVAAGAVDRLDLFTGSTFTYSAGSPFCAFSTNTITFARVGRFHVTVAMTTGAAPVITGPSATLTGATALSSYNAAQNSNSHIFRLTVNVTTRGATLVFSWTSLTQCTNLNTWVGSYDRYAALAA